MQTTSFNKMNLLPLSDAEMLHTNGGGWFEKFVKGTIWYEVYKGVTDNWDEVKARFSAGWNIDKKK